MDLELHTLREGDAYKWDSGKRTLTTGTKLEIGITTGDKFVQVQPAVVATSADKMDISFYKECTYTGGTQIENPQNKNHLSSKEAQTKAYLSPTVTYDIAAAQAGGGFDNQPAGDGLEILSNDAADTTQTVTVYGTITSATTTVTSETITLTGTTAVPTTEVTWQNILGIEISGNHAGTITVREASGSATVIALATGTNSAGIATLTLKNAYGSIPLHDCSGTSTAPIGIIGYDEIGTVISSVDALNNATEEEHGETAFWEVTKVLIGAVAADRNVNILSQRPGTRFSYSYMPGATGVGGTKSGTYYGGSSDCFILKPGTKYVIRFDNGSGGDNVVSMSLLFCELSEI
jgi:hypothetical protein